MKETSKSRSSEYAEGYLDGIKLSLWTCHDCGNVYVPTVDNCPNEILDSAIVALAHSKAKESDNEA